MVIVSAKGIATAAATSLLSAISLASPLPTESAAAERYVNEIVPSGTSISQALASMQNLGFTCLHIEHGAFADVGTLDNFEYCDHTEHAALIANRWQAAILQHGGAVSSVKVTFGRIGP